MSKRSKNGSRRIAERWYERFAGPTAMAGEYSARRRVIPTSLLLAAAVGGEVAGTASLRLSEGLTRPVFALGVVLLYGVSIAIFGRVLHRGMGLGVAYGILTASGLIAATLLSLVAFNEDLSVVQVGGIVVLGVGAVLLQMNRS